MKYETTMTTYRNLEPRSSTTMYSCFHIVKRYSSWELCDSAANIPTRHFLQIISYCALETHYLQLPELDLASAIACLSTLNIL